MKLTRSSPISYGNKTMFLVSSIGVFSIIPREIFPRPFPQISFMPLGDVFVNSCTVPVTVCKETEHYLFEHDFTANDLKSKSKLHIMQ